MVYLDISLPKKRKNDATAKNQDLFKIKNASLKSKKGSLRSTGSDRRLALFEATHSERKAGAEEKRKASREHAVERKNTTLLKWSSKPQQKPKPKPKPNVPSPAKPRLKELPRRWRPKVSAASWRGDPMPTQPGTHVSLNSNPLDASIVAD